MKTSLPTRSKSRQEKGRGAKGNSVAPMALGGVAMAALLGGFTFLLTNNITTMNAASAQEGHTSSNAPSVVYISDSNPDGPLPVQGGNGSDSGNTGAVGDTTTNSTTEGQENPVPQGNGSDSSTSDSTDMNLDVHATDYVGALYGADGSECDIYRVTPGQWLSEISGETGMSVERIAQANNIANVDLIYSGAALCIPR